MKVRLVYPISSLNIIDVNDIKEGVKFFYDELKKKYNHLKLTKILIMNMDTKEVFTYKIVKHNRDEIISRLEKKIDKLLKLSQHKMLEDNITKPPLV